MMLFQWTDENTEKLKELAKLNLTAGEIAKEFGGRVTRNAVIGKLSRLNVPLSGSHKTLRVFNPKTTKPWTDEETAQLVRMFEAGTLVQNMISALGRSRDAIRNRLAYVGRSPVKRYKEQRAEHSSSAPLRLARAFSFATPTPEECFSSPVSLLKAGPTHCRWIDGDPRQGAKCCGAPIVGGLTFPTRAYCGTHTLRTVSKFEPAAEAAERARRKEQARHISIYEARVFA